MYCINIASVICHSNSSHPPWARPPAPDAEAEAPPGDDRRWLWEKPGTLGKPWGKPEDMGKPWEEPVKIWEHYGKYMEKYENRLSK